MLRGLFLLVAFLFFLGLGSLVPFVASLGYVWVTIVRPQHLAYALLNQIPASLIMGAFAFLVYFLLDRRDPPRPGLLFALTAALAFWITLSTVGWAVVPEFAWVKWDWAFKTVVFSGLLMFVLRSRVQIEAFLQVYVFSLAMHFIPVGIKVFLSGGGYGRTLGLVGANAGLGEGATLAAVSVMVVPLILFLRKHTILLPRWNIVQLGYAGLVVLAIACTLGTYQRTGLVGLAVLALLLCLRARRKVLSVFLCAVAAGVASLITSDAWTERMETIADSRNEASAFGRLLVWRWTLDYVMTHPLGGGFEAYMINEFISPPNATRQEPIVITGKAFHSVYFEMLGEHGWVGLFLLLGLILGSFLIHQKIFRQTRGVPGLEWCQDLARALQVSLAVMAVCGAFIGVAFQPMLYFLFAATAALQHHVRRSLVPASVGANQRAAAPSAPWRAVPQLRWKAR
ncbi:putative O-glycosylation ligase, exosortase A system-associated [Roseomonas sp. SSH11]|uniref:O-glycosylation ligase, exosortase A system-associated n=1 Tax=Pararoseomonas baculiformis TaxID=2820812 RepID=A0ABS4AIG5_9PROT|nr:putative O-glycosylation ligase, exosortase A system-associated [Pararoseomonas baculiformis]